MSTDYPAQILNYDGTEIEVEGIVNFTDPANAPGGSQPTTHEAFTGGAGATILNTEFEPLPWVKDTGDTLVDLTDPLFPAIITAGVYAVTVHASTGGVTSGGYWEGQLDFDYNGADQFVIGESDTSNAANGGSIKLTLGLTYYIPAGGAIQFGAANHDGVATRTFTILSAYIQRLA